jgi:hypothetical protein
MPRTGLFTDKEIGTSPERLATDPAGGCSCTECDNASETSDEHATAPPSCC